MKQNLNIKDLYTYSVEYVKGRNTKNVWDYTALLEANEKHIVITNFIRWLENQK